MFKGKLRAIICMMAVIGMASFGVVSTGMAGNFPSRPLTFVVQWSAGGGTDIVARTIAAGMDKHAGFKVNVINKTGASGSIAHKYVLSSKADGYTIGTCCPTITMYKAGNVCDLTPADYEMLGMVARWSPFIGVKTDSKYKTIQDYIDYAKANPNLVTCGSCGVWTSYAAAEYLFGMSAGVKIRHVTTECTAMTIPLVVGGHIDSGIMGGPEILPHFKSGKLRPLVATTAERSPLFPDVPTVRELGYEWEFPTFVAVYTAKGVPADVKDALVKAVKTAVESEEYQSTISKMGMQPVWVGPDEVTDLFQRMKAYVDQAAAWKAGQ